MISPGYRQKEISPVLKKKQRVFRSSKIPNLVLFLLVIYLIFSLGSQFGRLHAMQQDLQRIQQQVEELQRKNAQLRDQLKLVQSDSYIEQKAREKLGLVKPGETKIVPVVPTGKH